MLQYRPCQDHHDSMHMEDLLLKKGNQKSSTDLEQTKTSLIDKLDGMWLINPWLLTSRV